MSETVAFGPIWAASALFFSSDALGAGSRPYSRSKNALIRSKLVSKPPPFICPYDLVISLAALGSPGIFCAAWHRFSSMFFGHSVPKTHYG
jgi:hypothetical protein